MKQSVIKSNANPVAKIVGGDINAHNRTTMTPDYNVEDDQIMNDFVGQFLVCHAHNGIQIIDGCWVCHAICSI